MVNLITCTNRVRLSLKVSVNACAFSPDAATILELGALPAEPVGCTLGPLSADFQRMGTNELSQAKRRTAAIKLTSQRQLTQCAHEWMPLPV